MTITIAPRTLVFLGALLAGGVVAHLCNAWLTAPTVVSVMGVQPDLGWNQPTWWPLGMTVIGSRRRM